MTRWLQAARQASEAGTKPTEPTKPTDGASERGGFTTPGRVLSVLSVSSEGEKPLAERPEAAEAAGVGPDDLRRLWAEHPDAVAYLRHLRDHGPATCGAAAGALGWGATRAWQAEARLRAAGLIRLDNLGRASADP